MNKIHEEKHSLRCRCVVCDGSRNHKIVTIEGGEISLGAVDFLALTCENCSKMTVIEPIPWPVGTSEGSKEVAAGIVQELQEYVDATC